MVSALQLLLNLGTTKYPCKKIFDPWNTPEKIFWTHETPTRKTFWPTKTPWHVARDLRDPGWHGAHGISTLDQTQEFSCEYCRIFKVTCFEGYLRMATFIRCYFDTMNLKQFGFCITYSFKILVSERKYKNNLKNHES